MASSLLNRTVTAWGRPVQASLAVLGILLAAADADAYAISYDLFSGGERVPSYSYVYAYDTVTVDIYLDTEPGLNLFSLGVLWPTQQATFLAEASSGPSYILYSPGAAMTGHAQWLEPYGFPWVEWPGDKPPGTSQVNVAFAGVPLAPSLEAGTDIWVASLVFQVAYPPGYLYAEQIQLTLAAAGNAFVVDDGVFLGPADVPITRRIPEPGTAALVVGGVALGLVAQRRRR
jgi:hypothetical protein